ncbi:MAG TPA: hypothetical protein VM533_00390 [Fimbriiglobus sp.]|nr:hypothetical protein [Fimbriiglobus sp.]
MTTFTPSLQNGVVWLGLASKQDVVPEGINGRNFELWQPLLALAHWLESRGVGRLLELVRKFALTSVETARDDSVPEADESLLELLAEAIRDGTAPTPSELLDRAQQRDPVTFKSWHPTSITRRLKIYGIEAPKKSNGQRRFRHATSELLRKIQRHYGIDLGFSDPGPPIPWEKVTESH